MTFPCSLRFEPDTTKGPGFGLILATCPGFSGNAESLLVLIRNAAGNSLGLNGWQTGDGWLAPDAIQIAGETLILSFGQSVVPRLEEQTNYQVILFIDMEHVWQGVLSVGHLTLPSQTAPTQQAPTFQMGPQEQPQPAASQPLGAPLGQMQQPLGQFPGGQQVPASANLLPDMGAGQPAAGFRSQPQAGTPLSFGSRAASSGYANPMQSASGEFLTMAERPKHYFRAVLNFFFAILIIVLLAAAGYFFYTQVLPKTQAEKPEAPVEILKQESANTPPGKEAPVKYAPEDLKGARGLSVAKDAVKRKLPPEVALPLAQQLLAVTGDLKAQDGGRIILEDLAQKNNAHALMLLGDIYSPAQPPSGTIQKNRDFARDCYKKAIAGGAAEAQKHLDLIK